MKPNFTTTLLALIYLNPITLFASSHHGLTHSHLELQQSFPSDLDPVPAETRAFWMRRARQALLELSGTACPFAAFGSVIVNHTGRPDTDPGDLICIGANNVFHSGNPTMHGEIAAINNCTHILSTSPHNLGGSQILDAWKTLSIYTTAEACAMCATAISWGGFREYIYASSIGGLIDMGWKQLPLESKEIIRISPLEAQTRIVGGVLEEEMDVLFGWQYRDGECPEGCARDGQSGNCKGVR